MTNTYRINAVLKYSAFKFQKEVLNFLAIDFAFDCVSEAEANIKFVQTEMEEIADTLKRIAISNGLKDLSQDPVILPHSPIMFFDVKTPASMHRLMDLTPIYSHLGSFETLKQDENFLKFLDQKGIYSFSDKNYTAQINSKLGKIK